MPAGNSIYLQTDMLLTDFLGIGLDATWEIADKAWVSPLMQVRGYKAFGLQLRLPFRIVKQSWFSCFIGPSLGLWYATYVNTPLAFAFSDAGLLFELDLKVDSIISPPARKGSLDAKQKLPLSIRLQVPWKVVFRKDISFQLTTAVRLALLWEIE